MRLQHTWLDRREEKPARTRAYGYLVGSALVLGCLAGGATVAAWDGTRSSETLSFKRALATVRKADNPQEERRAALLHMHELSLRLANVTRALEASGDVLAPDARIIREKHRHAWGN